jgi:uncharacterized protein with LGFP repeats
VTDLSQTRGNRSPATLHRLSGGAWRGIYWSTLGWEGTKLGYPTSDEFSIPGKCRSNFQHGYITWNAATLKTTVYYTEDLSVRVAAMSGAPIDQLRTRRGEGRGWA